MKAGRALDALVGERVMGCDMTKPEWFKYPIGLPCYSTDIAAAWTVVDTLRDRFGYVMLNEFTDSHSVQIMQATGEPIASAFGDTIPHAICLAALNAVGVEVPA